MPSPEARAEALVRRFTAAGLAPRKRDRGNHTRIEMKVPDSATRSRQSWQELLTLLETADWFGLASSRRGLVAWAAVLKDPRPAAKTARGSHRDQL
ncbi:hypothetical protein [Streptomyces huiliensis]|uniref:hypothetical protein n=1 Tax=Streptomyces huiliensis TaxID=2876027 RepID=UPI001CBC6EEC|nr:hypothetical protein [Streptomyces huiliensis]MBZ4321477.1 hypothetical protein [Streptomyces huiliensis]